MGFMRAYKHLDTLCRDMNNIGVTGYIEDMEHTQGGKSRVSGWENDCQQLKHYRYIRNQIAHETYANEETVSSEADADWLDDFYDRILRQTDPLALYRRAARSVSAQKPAARSTPSPCARQTNQAHSGNGKKENASAAVILCIVLSAIFFTVLIAALRY